MFITVVPPDPPSTVMVTATTTTQISLSWINPFNGNSLITMATVTYQSTGGQNTTENANTITSHTITGLMPNMGYNIFLQSFNVIGASGSVSVTGMTMALRKCYCNNKLSLIACVFCKCLFRECNFSAYSGSH